MVMGACRRCSTAFGLNRCPRTTLSFAATHVGVNVAFARVWFGNEWIYAILVLFISPNMVVVAAMCSPLSCWLKTVEGLTWNFTVHDVLGFSSKKHG